ncbi:predicted protein [Chaetomium globosum CBS 148.51]|uniref:Uncharacterized protein n=1 Tax=Chaetomium globosum (strain ATCC 6205 / CBS 148.51 / DSM 1962 / NBRC 6347 / NRRL 1970) TaxID=306901 RepID=Q2H300_CHAGB|nr:uncharacterized protein CHGG_03846 [Chaetomium globosum CBS 148.51]EAQ87227.1 predicted protein [Chaetomium globosum CBS 148.51]
MPASKPSKPLTLNPTLGWPQPEDLDYFFQPCAVGTPLAIVASQAHRDIIEIWEPPNPGGARSDKRIRKAATSGTKYIQFSFAVTASDCRPASVNSPVVCAPQTEGHARSISCHDARMWRRVPPARPDSCEDHICASPDPPGPASWQVEPHRADALRIYRGSSAGGPGGAGGP